MNSTQDNHAANAKTQPAEGRDAQGRFAKGNPGGPGNPYARQIAGFRKALVSFFTDEDWKEIALALREKATMGNLNAIKILCQYFLGKPKAAVDPDRLDVDEWQGIQERSRPAAEMTEVLHGVPAHMASGVMNAA